MQKKEVGNEAKEEAVVPTTTTWLHYIIIILRRHYYSNLRRRQAWPKKIVDLERYERRCCSQSFYSSSSESYLAASSSEMTLARFFPSPKLVPSRKILLCFAYWEPAAFTNCVLESFFLSVDNIWMENHTVAWLGQIVMFKNENLSFLN